MRNVCCDLFRKHGIEKVITVDPHTTHTLRTVYPKYIEGFDIEVKSYLEVLAESGIEPDAQINEELALHDSCIYARQENVVEQPRELLGKAGDKTERTDPVRQKHALLWRTAESLFPAESHRIAGNRTEQLAETESNVATMCPICLVSLRNAAKGSMQINDLSDTLAKAYGA